MQDPAQTWVIFAVIVGVIALIAVAWAYSRKRNSERLRTHFGSEYERAVMDFGDRDKAERDLSRRETQLRKLQIRPLSPDERERFMDEWRRIQARFVDNPESSVMDADRLVARVLEARGYPTNDVDERFDDLSAAYPHVIGSYREACMIVSHKADGLTTEDLRRAMVLYRDLFEELFREDASNEKLRRVS